MTPAILLNIALAIVGWVVVHCLTVRREHAKEKRNAIHEIIRKIEELERKALNYHTSESIPSNSFAREIKHDIRLINRRLNIVQFNSGLQKIIVLNLRKSITNDNFESMDFTCQCEDSKIINNISYSINQVILELESLS